MRIYVTEQTEFPTGEEHDHWEAGRVARGDCLRAQNIDRVRVYVRKGVNSQQRILKFDVRPFRAIPNFLEDIRKSSIPLAVDGNDGVLAVGGEPVNPGEPDSAWVFTPACDYTGRTYPSLAEAMNATEETLRNYFARDYDDLDVEFI